MSNKIETGQFVMWVLIFSTPPATFGKLCHYRKGLKKPPIGKQVVANAVPKRQRARGDCQNGRHCKSCAKPHKIFLA